MGQKLTPMLKTIQCAMGAVASPFDCWLALRGLRTLHLRVERQCQSAMSIANYLSNHPYVQKVHYPGLSKHPQHSIASRQMQSNLYGGVLSFEVQDEVMAMAVAGAIKTITRATSLGGTETLIEHRATIEPPHRISSPKGLLRLSVGVEHVEDLIQDLDTALLIAQNVVARS
jgi:cystathionine gamma-synthase